MLIYVPECNQMLSGNGQVKVSHLEDPSSLLVRLTHFRDHLRNDEDKYIVITD